MQANSFCVLEISFCHQLRAEFGPHRLAPIHVLYEVLEKGIFVSFMVLNLSLVVMVGVTMPMVRPFSCAARWFYLLCSLRVSSADGASVP